MLLDMSDTTSITIRHVPVETRDVLAARAKRDGRSLQEHLLKELIRVADLPDMHQWLSEARAAVEASGRDPIGAEAILAAIHDGRR